MNHFIFFLRFILVLFLILSVGGCSDDDPSGEALVGWAVGGPITGGGTIIHTRNGQTWVQQGESQIPYVRYTDVSAVDSLNAWVVGESSPNDGQPYGTILRTRDGGQTWIRQGSPLDIPDEELSSVSAADGDVAWVVGGSGIVLKTTDSGVTWVQQALDMLPNTAFQRVYALDRENVWAVGSDNMTTAVIIHTSDGGETWARQGEKDIPPDPLMYYAFIDVHAVDTKTAWAVGARSTAFMTTDGGQNWTNKTPACTLSLDNNGVCALTCLRGWVVADTNNICFTADGGDTWTNQTPPASLEAPTLSSALLGVTAIDRKRAWIVGENPIGDEHALIYHTTNGGNLWQKQVSPVNACFRRVSFAGARR